MGLDHNLLCDFLISVYHVIFAPTQVGPCIICNCLDLCVCVYRQGPLLKFLMAMTDACSWQLVSSPPGRS